MTLRTSDFDYFLPSGRVAAEPAARRDDSRLLVLDRRGGDLRHERFRSLPALLEPGDLVVLNETRVLPRRLVGRRGTGGRVEALLVAPHAEGGWRALVRARRALRDGEEVVFEGRLRALSAARLAPGEHRLEFPEVEDVDAALEACGRAPLPPYIPRPRADDPRRAADRERYQTVYARAPGSIAAPTAGLHFTEELFSALHARGVGVARVTLHVGPGTFRPVRTESLDEHPIEAERYRVPEAAAAAIRDARARGGRVVAIGTTTTRTLEGTAADDGSVRAGEGWTDLFIRPPFRFRAVDALVTNFHLPRSTLLALVCAFAGRERILDAYREAIERGYRFYSYGDAMLIV